MTTPLYLRSSDGSDSDNGSTWALAKATFTGIAGVDSAGDTVFVSVNHAQSAAAASLITWAGTAAGPMYLLSVDDTGDPEPATTLSAGASITTTGAFSIQWVGSFYAYGITFNVSDGGNNANFALNAAGALQHGIILDTCTINIVTTRSDTGIILGQGATTAGKIELRDCTLEFSASTQGIKLGPIQLLMEGCDLAATSSAMTTGLFVTGGSSSRSGTVVLRGCDLTNMGASSYLVNAAGWNAHNNLKAYDCKLNASFSGPITGTLPEPGTRVEMFNCDSGDTTYQLWIEDYAGSIVEETTIVRTSGASESRKMVSLAVAKFPLLALRGPEISVYNDTVGSSVTVTLEFVHDSATALQNDEFWIDVLYLGTSGAPLGLIGSSRVSGILTTPADTTDSSETWTTTGMSNPNTRKCTVTFTPQEAGYIHIVPCLAVASTTVYYDPEVTVS